MTIERKAWGQAPDEDVDLYTLEAGDMQVSIATYGGVVTSLSVPDRYGKSGEVTLGYDTLTQYLSDHCFFGCLVGRVANRVSGASFTLDGRAHELDRNHGAHQLHGGTQGFGTRVWEAEADEVDGVPSLKLSLLSPEGDQGYPGSLMSMVTYSLFEDKLRIAYMATTTAPTPVNLTNHTYFNLAGAGKGDCLGHRLALNSIRFLETDDELIPTGQQLSVGGTPLDFPQMKPVGAKINEDHLQLRLGQGYDHYFVLPGCNGKLVSAAAVEEPASGRRMEMLTTCPGFQFYSGNHIPQGLAGRQGEIYGPRSGLCLEAQGFVDAPNRPEFPSVLLHPGEVYAEVTEYRFSTDRDDCGCQ